LDTRAGIRLPGARLSAHRAPLPQHNHGHSDRAREFLSQEYSSYYWFKSLAESTLANPYQEQQWGHRGAQGHCYGDRQGAESRPELQLLPSRSVRMEGRRFTQHISGRK